VLCKHEVTGSIPVGSTSFRWFRLPVPRVAPLWGDRLHQLPQNDDPIGGFTSREPSCPIARSRQLNTDIVKRAINTRRSGSGPSGGSDASVVELVLGPSGSSGSEAAGNQDSLSKSMTLTEKAALILRDRCRFRRRPPGRTSGQVDFRPDG
jgi:hypothetical protein